MWECSGGLRGWSLGGGERGLKRHHVSLFVNPVHSLAAVVQSPHGACVVSSGVQGSNFGGDVCRVGGHQVLSWDHRFGIEFPAMARDVADGRAGFEKPAVCRRLVPW